MDRMDHCAISTVKMRRNSPAFQLTPFQVVSGRMGLSTFVLLYVMLLK